jgi:hypothetical protein
VAVFIEKVKSGRLAAAPVFESMVKYLENRGEHLND